MTDKLIEQIKRHEGTVKKGSRHMPYKCPAGKLTIGYGRNIDDNGISEGEAMALLRADIQSAEQELVAAFPWAKDLDDARKDVLINMCFNMGINKLKGFKNTLSYAEAGKYDKAADEMINSAWYKQTGNRAVELVAQMRSGQYQKVA